MLHTQNLNGEWEFHFTEKRLSEIDPSKISYECKMPVPGCFFITYRKPTRNYRTMVEKLIGGLQSTSGGMYSDTKVRKMN